jgi:acyl carrier protein
VRYGVKVSDRINKFLADRFLFDESAVIDPAQSLMNAGILDSTGAMELVLFLEDEFKIRVADSELVPENLDSIRQIAAYVSRKTGNHVA